MLSLIPVAVATNKEVEFSPVGDNIHRLNYGVIFKKDSTLVLSQEYWTHTFHLQLPNSIKPTNVSTRCNRNESHCYKWNDLVSVFQTLHVETQSHVKEVVKTIRSLIPQTNFPTKSSKKSPRAFLPFIGSLSRSLFGTATIEDVQLLARHVNALNARTTKFALAMQQYDAHLSSFISIVNNRTTNLLKGIQLNTKVINNIAAAVDAKFVQMEHAMTNVSSLLIQQINEANVLRSNLDNLQSAIQNLIEGKLSPFLIPKQKLKSVIQDISKMLRTSHKGFYLTHTNPTYYYSHGKFLYARNNKHVYLSVKFPISTHKAPMQLYEVTSLPVPINISSSHATQLLNMPKYFAITKHHDYYLNLKSDVLLNCVHAGPTILCDHNLPLKPITSKDCSIALFNNDVKAIHKLCNFKFIPNVLNSNIIELSPTSVLIYKIQSLSLDCPKEKKVISGCAFCIIHVPCKCSLSTDSLYLPPRLVNCYQSQQNFTILHSFNLALLQQFFDENKLANLLGDTIFPKPIDLKVPLFKIFNHSMDKVIADDHRYQLSLNKMAEAAKKDETIFKQLSEPLIDGLINIPSSWPDTNAILIFTTMGGTVVSLIFCVLALIKLRKLKIELLILQQVAQANSQTIPSFIYQAKTTAPVLKAPVSIEKLLISEISWIHAVFTVGFIIIIILCIIIFYLWRSRPSKETILQLEITSGGKCAIIPLLTLPLCPSYYKFQSPVIRNLTTSPNFLNFKLYADWDQFDVIDKQSSKTIQIPKVITLNWLNHSNVTKILKQPYCAYVMVTHQGFNTIITPSSLSQNSCDLLTIV